MFTSKNRFFVALGEVLLVALSVTIAWLLRFDFAFPNPQVLLAAMPILMLLRVLGMARFNLFHGYWRHTGISDALDILKAVALGSVGFLAAERWLLGEKRFPLSVYCIELILTVCMLVGVRVLSRTVFQNAMRSSERDNRKTVVVIGAGCAAAMLLRELPRSPYLPVALVDDDPAKAGMRLHGVPVAGTVTDLVHVVRAYRPDELMIAIPSASGEQMQRIIDLCDQTRLRFRTIPSLRDLINDTVTVDQLRDVKFEDLLGRDPVCLDVDSVRRRIAGRVVMVTGAAGSIGSELCHQLLNYNPLKLVCLDQAETPLFNLQNAQTGSACNIVYCVADITDATRLRDVIQEHDVQVVIHAAAYKHVPLMEENLSEALKNNVFGLQALMEVADQSGCEDFLLISSDKAVNPTSFMGCTKRIGELMVAARPSRMRCLSVRFGNVLGSQGSVIPLFQEQIRVKRTITVTHPDITRYFMTIPEAVSLVLQAFSIGEKRDVLVLDMGKPVRILDMAKTLIRLSGLHQDEVKISFTGLRPGEKLFEDLFYGFERRSNTGAQKVFRTQGQTASWPELLQLLSELRAESATGIPDRIRAKVKEIVPEYLWVPRESDVHVSAPLLHESKLFGEPVPAANANN
ncbi:MAG TPA: nucleoside-diphosphate sugar epimerase/dehydratase [Terracidiphilus sp.]|jgi:FlaA1/EpsC-like NDP-sugar epimerase